MLMPPSNMKKATFKFSSTNNIHDVQNVIKQYIATRRARFYVNFLDFSSFTPISNTQSVACNSCWKSMECGMFMTSQ